MSALWANRPNNGDRAPNQAVPSRQGELPLGAGEDAGESRVRENRMHGLERGRRKHDPSVLGRRMVQCVGGLLYHP